MRVWCSWANNLGSLGELNRHSPILMSNESRTRYSKYKERVRTEQERWDGPPAPVQNLLSIVKFMDQNFGSDSFVLDESGSRIVHVDVYVIYPSIFRSHWTLLTSGMSDLAMRNPRSKEKSYAEVCLCLPNEWPTSQSDMKWATPDCFWPIGVLKSWPDFLTFKIPFCRGATQWAASPSLYRWIPGNGSSA